MTTDGVRLGDLLTGAGLLQASDLREAMMISKQQGLPVGRVLIMSGYLTEQHLQAAVQAQSLLKDGLIEFDLVIKALTMVGTEEITLEEAFKRLKWNQQSDAVTNKLGELLLAADIVPVDALNAALLQCQSIGLPLGRVLIGNGNLTEQMLAATLNAQVFIRDKKLTREQAIQGLRSAKERQIPIEQYLAETGALSLPTAETVRLGELFVMAGLIDEPALMSAVEVGLLNEQPVGQVLLQTNLISQEILDAALDLQAMVGAGAIKKDEAAKFLSTVKDKKVSVGEAIAIGHQKPSKKKAAAASAVEEPAMPAIEPLHLYQFLQLSGIITAKDIEQAIRVGSKDTAIMARMLRLSGVMEKALVDAAEKCNDLICSGVLNHEQGMIVLKNCERNNFTLEQAFNELGWNTAPLRADPGVPEALLDTPDMRKKSDAVTDTTAQLSEARTPESETLTAQAGGSDTSSDTTSPQPTIESASPFGQPGATEVTAPSLNPLGEAPQAIELAQASNSHDAQAALAKTNPFDLGMSAAADAKSEADALAEFGSSINQSESSTGQAASSLGSASPEQPKADAFSGSGDAWQAPSPDEWMPKPSEPSIQQTEQPIQPATAPAQAPAPQAPAAFSDPWQAGGQAQVTADPWQGGQAQHGHPQAAPHAALHLAPPGAPAATPQAAAPEPAAPAAPAPTASGADWNPVADANEWSTPEDWGTTPAAPAQPVQQAAAQGDWAAPAPAPAQPEWAPASTSNAPGQPDWAASSTPNAPAQPDWAAAPAPPAAAQAQAPATAADWAAPGAPNAPAQPDWAASSTPNAPVQPDWAASNAPAAAPAQPDWAAQPAQAPQTTNDWAAPPQAQPAPAAQAAPAPSADWAGSSSSTMPAPQSDWAGQPAPAAQPQSEWQPPTSAAPQEAAWGAPPDAAQPAAPAQQSWQSAAPSPLPGWQSTSTTNQDAWQPASNSPAAQMFQEAAQSLQSAPPQADGQQPPVEAAPQGPMDLFSDGEEDHADQQDKPKKRLSDLMPKLGPKL